jgi:hypothetical protein
LVRREKGSGKGTEFGMIMERDQTGGGVSFDKGEKGSGKGS